MQDFKIECSIISLQEYMEQLDFATAEEVFEEFGVVAKHYVHAVGEGSDYGYRCVVPIIYNDIGTAVHNATQKILELCEEHIR